MAIAIAARPAPSAVCTLLGITRRLNAVLWPILLATSIGAGDAQRAQATRTALIPPGSVPPASIAALEANWSRGSPAPLYGYQKARWFEALLPRVWLWPGWTKTIVSRQGLVPIPLDSFRTDVRKAPRADGLLLRIRSERGRGIAIDTPSAFLLYVALQRPRQIPSDEEGTHQSVRRLLEDVTQFRLTDVAYHVHHFPPQVRGVANFVFASPTGHMPGLSDHGVAAEILTVRGFAGSQFLLLIVTKRESKSEATAAQAGPRLHFGASPRPPVPQDVPSVRRVRTLLSNPRGAMGDLVAALNALEAKLPTFSAVPRFPSREEVLMTQQVASAVREGYSAVLAVLREASPEQRSVAEAVKHCLQLKGQHPEVRGLKAQVRSAAVDALQRSGGPQAVDLLRQMISVETETMLLEREIGALAHLSLDEARRLATQLFSDAQGTTERGRAIRACYFSLLCARPDSEQLDLAQQHYENDSSMEVRLQALRYVGQLAADTPVGAIRSRCLQVLRAGAEHTADRIRHFAVVQLGSLGDKDSVPVLTKALTAPDANTRFMAARGIARIKQWSFRASTASSEQEKASAVQEVRQRLAARAK